jgi:hypothetical protein
MTWESNEEGTIKIGNNWTLIESKSEVLEQKEKQGQRTFEASGLSLDCFIHCL